MDLAHQGSPWVTFFRFDHHLFRSRVVELALHRATRTDLEAKSQREAARPLDTTAQAESWPEASSIVKYYREQTSGISTNQDPDFLLRAASDGHVCGSP